MRPGTRPIGAAGRRGDGRGWWWARSRAGQAAGTAAPRRPQTSCGGDGSRCQPLASPEAWSVGRAERSGPMTRKRASYLGVVAMAIALAGTASVITLDAQQPAGGAVRIDADDIGGVVTRAERAGGRRVGDRGDDRSSDPVRADRGHRRPGPLRGARPAEGQVQGVGARLRPRRFAEGRRRARQAAESHARCRRRARRRRRSTTRRSTGTRCSRSRTRASSAARATFPRTSPRATGSPW